MKATKLLEQDHEKVKDLFDEYENAGDRAFTKKKNLVQKMERELTVHASIEEEIFYPAIKQTNTKESRDLVFEAIEEHRQVKELLHDLASMDAEDQEYDAKVKVLTDNVRHHIREEENEIFDQAREKLGDDRLEALGEQMQQRKEALMAQVG